MIPAIVRLPEGGVGRHLQPAGHREACCPGPCKRLPSSLSDATNTEAAVPTLRVWCACRRTSTGRRRTYSATTEASTAESTCTASTRGRRTCSRLCRRIKVRRSRTPMLYTQLPHVQGGIMMRPAVHTRSQSMHLRELVCLCRTYSQPACSCAVAACKAIRPGRLTSDMHMAMQRMP